jgi:hypothetical protein
MGWVKIDYQRPTHDHLTNAKKVEFVM